MPYKTLSWQLHVCKPAKFVAVMWVVIQCSWIIRCNPNNRYKGDCYLAGFLFLETVRTWKFFSFFFQVLSDCYAYYFKYKFELIEIKLIPLCSKLLKRGHCKRKNVWFHMCFQPCKCRLYITVFNLLFLQVLSWPIIKLSLSGINEGQANIYWWDNQPIQWTSPKLCNIIKNRQVENDVIGISNNWQFDTGSWVKSVKENSFAFIGREVSLLRA